MFKEIFDIKNANYIPKPELAPYQQIIKDFDIDISSTIIQESANTYFDAYNSQIINEVQFLDNLIYLYILFISWYS